MSPAAADSRTFDPPSPRSCAPLRLLAVGADPAVVVEVRQRVQPGRRHLRGQPHHRELERAGGPVCQGLHVDDALHALGADPAAVVEIRLRIHRGSGDLRRQPPRALTGRFIPAPGDRDVAVTWRGHVQWGEPGEFGVVGPARSDRSAGCSPIHSEPRQARLGCERSE
jgi:hypothetical protein